MAFPEKFFLSYFFVPSEMLLSSLWGAPGFVGPWPSWAGQVERVSFAIFDCATSLHGVGASSCLPHCRFCDGMLASKSFPTHSNNAHQSWKSTLIHKLLRHECETIHSI